MILFTVMVSGNCSISLCLDCLAKLQRIYAKCSSDKRIEKPSEITLTTNVRATPSSIKQRERECGSLCLDFLCKKYSEDAQ